MTRSYTGSLRGILRRCDAWTLWAFNAPQHLGRR